MQCGSRLLQQRLLRLQSLQIALRRQMLGPQPVSQQNRIGRLFGQPGPSFQLAIYDPAPFAGVGEFLDINQMLCQGAHHDCRAHMIHLQGALVCAGGCSGGLVGIQNFELFGFRGETAAQLGNQSRIASCAVGGGLGGFLGWGGRPAPGNARHLGHCGPA